MITCTKRIEFDSAHRIPNHTSGCKMLHGHRYVIEATFAAEELDDMGMVIDFAIIKEKLGSWINKNWDHNTILYQGDLELGVMIENYTGQKVFFVDFYPTAENLARFLLNKVCHDLFSPLGVSCIKIKLYETPSSYSEALL